MIGEKLFEILKSLDPVTFRQLRKVFQSPLFTVNQTQLALYDYLAKYYPDFNASQLGAEIIYGKIFPGKPFKEGVLRVKIRQFTKLVEDYLVWLQVQKDEVRYRSLLVDAYGERNLYRCFKKEVNTLLEKQKKESFRDVEYHQSMLHLNSTYYFHPLTEKLTLQDEAIVELMDHIDRQYILLKCRVGTEMKSRSSMIKRKYRIPFLEQILAEGRSGFMVDNLPFHLYQLLFLLYEDEEQELTYTQLKVHFCEHINQLRRFDQSLLLTQLINYTIRKVNSGQVLFYKEALDLYKLGLDYKLVIENETINEAVFGNIVSLSCHAQELSWTKFFIEKYQHYLKDEIRADVVALHTGLWYFYQGDFEKAYSLFYYHPFSHYYQPKARFTLIRTVFEQFLQHKQNFEFLLDQIEAFKKFLSRSKLIATRQILAYQNCILIIKNMTTGILQRTNPLKLKESLIHQVEEKESVMAKDWLIKKINQLE